MLKGMLGTPWLQTIPAEFKFTASAGHMVATPVFGYWCFTNRTKFYACNCAEPTPIPLAHTIHNQWNAMRRVPQGFGKHGTKEQTIQHRITHRG